MFMVPRFALFFFFFFGFPRWLDNKVQDSNKFSTLSWSRVFIPTQLQYRKIIRILSTKLMQLLIVIGNWEKKKKKKEETILTESKFPVRMASALFNYAHVNILSICIQFCTSLECIRVHCS